MVNASEQYRTQKAIRFARHGRSKITEKDGNAGAETRRENPQVMDGQSGDSRARGGRRARGNATGEPGPNRDTAKKFQDDRWAVGKTRREMDRPQRPDLRGPKMGAGQGAVGRAQKEEASPRTLPTLREGDRGALRV